MGCFEPPFVIGHCPRENLTTVREERKAAVRLIRGWYHVPHLGEALGCLQSVGLFGLQSLGLDRMHLGKLHLRNFRSFEEASLEFHSRVTILTGRNNSGKSNVIDALSILHSVGMNDRSAGINQRGGFQKVVFGKDIAREVELGVEFSLDEREQATLHKAIVEILPTLAYKNTRYSGIGTTLGYALVLRASGFAERLVLGWDFGDIDVLKTERSSDHDPLEHLVVTQVELATALDRDIPPEGSIKYSSAGAISGDVGPGLSHFNPPNDFMRHLVSTVQSGLRSLLLRVGPNRNPSATAQITGTSTLQEEGANLADVLDFLRSNHPSRFAEFEREFRSLVPESAQLATPRVGGPSTTLTIAESWLADTPGFDLAASSFGERNLLVLLARVLERDPNVLMAIEEPENSIHPHAQRALASLFWRAAERRQILMTSHSPVILSQFPLDALRLVSRDDGRSRIHQVDPSNIALVIRELGFRPGDLLEPDAIVLVEGETDERVLTAWLSSLREVDRVGLLHSLRCIFLGVRGLSNIPFYLDARILNSRAVPPLVFIIADGDIHLSPQQNDQWRMVRSHLTLPEERIFSLEQGKILEDYLLRASVLARTFPSELGSESQVAKLLTSSRQAERNSDAKRVLVALLEAKGLRYSVDAAERIARAFLPLEIDEYIRRLLQTIAGTVKNSQE